MKRLYRVLRRERDSNSRKSYPFVSLANWWFQPLTHLSVVSFLKSAAKIHFFFIEKNFEP